MSTNKVLCQKCLIMIYNHQWERIFSKLHRGYAYFIDQHRSSVLVAKSCRTLCDPMDCSPPGFSVHGIFQARILECVAISFSSKEHIHTGEYYWVIKENKITPFGNNMDATRDSRTKWSKSEKERQIPHDIICTWTLKYGVNETIYETEIDS